MKNKILTLAKMQESGNKWAVITINETGFYRADIIKKAGTIDGVYLVNLSEPTCLCSPAVNYPAIRLKNFLHNTEGFTDEKVFELEMDQALSEWTYYSEYYKANLVKYYKDELEEEIFDNEAANPCVC